MDFLISEQEWKQIYDNPSAEYIYVDKSIIHLHDAIEILSSIDDDADSPLAQLKKHLERSSNIAEIDMVVEGIEYADALLQRNYQKLDEDTVEQIINDFPVVISHIEDGSLIVDISS